MAILEGAPNAFNGVQRKLGFEDAVSAAGLRVVASQTANWETSQASQVAAAMLTAHPDLEGAAVRQRFDGARRGRRRSRRRPHGRRSPSSASTTSPRCAPLIADGRMLATADQHGDRLAVYGIEYALEILKTKATPADRETPVDLVVKK